MCREKEFEMSLLEKLIKQYRGATKKTRSKIISEYCELTGLNREAVKKRFTRFMSKEVKHSFKGKRGRKKIYSNQHKEIVKICWQYLLNPCAERLYPVMAETIEHLKSKGVLRNYSQEVIDRVISMSVGTLKRIVMEFDKPVFKKRHKGNAFLYTQIPIIADFGKNAYKSPGYIEVDFVEHNGGNSSGRFAITAVYTDLSSQWTVRASGWGKNLESIKEMDEIVHGRIPFPVLHYHPDNDKGILKVLFDRVRNKQIGLSRSRPYKKNDNAHVEQKGGDKVRKLVGYLRYDTEEEVKILNQIYHVADLIENFFVPTMKLKYKIKDEKAKTVKKIYEKAKTPYHRLLESDALSEELKEQLRKQYNRLSLVELKQKLDELLDRLLMGKIKYKNRVLQGQNFDLTSTKFQGHPIMI